MTLHLWLCILIFKIWLKYSPNFNNFRKICIPNSIKVVKKKCDILGSQYMMILSNMRPYTLKTEEEWLVPLYQTTWCHISLPKKSRWLQTLRKNIFCWTPAWSAYKWVVLGLFIWYKQFPVLCKNDLSNINLINFKFIHFILLCLLKRRYQ